MHHRRKFRFSLRLLFAVVTVGSVLCWGFCWPRWRNYREQVKFVASIQQLKAGMTTREASQSVKPGSHCVVYESGTARPPDQPIRTVFYTWPNAVYCIQYSAMAWRGVGLGVHYDMNNPCKKIQVFRLPPMSADYQGQDPSIVGLGEMSYPLEFTTFLTTNGKRNSWIQHELIYSAPSK